MAPHQPSAGHYLRSDSGGSETPMLPDGPDPAPAPAGVTDRLHHRPLRLLHHGHLQAQSPGAGERGGAAVSAGSQPAAGGLQPGGAHQQPVLPQAGQHHQSLRGHGDGEHSPQERGEGGPPELLQRLGGAGSSQNSRQTLGTSHPPPAEPGPGGQLQALREPLPVLPPCHRPLGSQHHPLAPAEHHLPGRPAAGQPGGEVLRLLPDLFPLPQRQGGRPRLRPPARAVHQLEDVLQPTHPPAQRGRHQVLGARGGLRAPRSLPGGSFRAEGRRRALRLRLLLGHRLQRRSSQLLRGLPARPVTAASASHLPPPAPAWPRGSGFPNWTTSRRPGDGGRWVLPRVRRRLAARDEPDGGHGGRLPTVCPAGRKPTSREWSPRPHGRHAGGGGHPGPGGASPPCLPSEQTERGAPNGRRGAGVTAVTASQSGPTAGGPSTSPTPVGAAPDGHAGGAWGAGGTGTGPQRAEPPGTAWRDAAGPASVSGKE